MEPRFAQGELFPPEKAGPVTRRLAKLPVLARSLELLLHNTCDPRGCWDDAEVGVESADGCLYLTVKYGGRK